MSKLFSKNRNPKSKLDGHSAPRANFQPSIYKDVYSALSTDKKEVI